VEDRPLPAAGDDTDAEQRFRSGLEELEAMLGEESD
jgi:hypothetical protein